MRNTLLLLTILVVFISAKLNAQESAEVDTTKNFRFRPVPYLNYDRTQGFALGAVLMGMYKINPRDTLSPESLSGVLGLYTTEKNAVYLGFSAALLWSKTNGGETFAIGAADRGFQFYSDVVGGFVDYNTASFFIYTVGQRMIIPKLYLGPTYTYVETETVIVGRLLGEQEDFQRSRTQTHLRST